MMGACGCERFSGKVVAEVNGEDITTKDLEEAMRMKLSSQLVQGVISPLALQRLKEEVLSEAINGLLIEQRAEKLSIKVSKQEIDDSLAELKESYEGSASSGVLVGIKINDAQWKKYFKKRRLYEKVIEKDVYDRISVSEEEVREFYVANRARYRSETTIRLAQIVVDDEGKAQRMLVKIEQGEDFTTIAKKESIAPEGANGGDLGFISRGEMPPAIDQVAFTLTPGKISAVIKSPYGFHILKVLERREQVADSFESAKERVITDLKEIKGEEAFQLWLANIRKSAEIKINKDVVEAFMSAKYQDHKLPEGS